MALFLPLGVQQEKAFSLASSKHNGFWIGYWIMVELLADFIYLERLLFEETIFCCIVLACPFQVHYYYL